MSGSRTYIAIAAVVAVILAAGGIFLATRGGSDDDGGNATATTGSSTNATPGTSPTADTPENALKAAGAQWDATNSAHFDLQVDGKAYLDDAKTLELRSANGDLVRPDSVSATAKINVSLVAFDIGIIAIGDTMYQTNIVTGKWENAPEDFGYNPAVLFSPTDGIGATVQKLQSPSFGGTETVEGRETRKVTGTVTGADVKAVTSGTLTGDAIDATIWIATDNADIVKVVLTAPATGSDAAVTWNLVVTKQNEPITIEAPQV